MKLFKIFSVACAMLVFPMVGNASVTLTIGTAGWGNFTTPNTNGMTWGLVVSSDGSAFTGATAAALSAALVNFAIPVLNPLAASNPVQIGSSNFYFVEAQSLTSNSGPPTLTNGFMNTDQFNLVNPVGAGDPLGLLWFADATAASGNHFGFQNLNFATPADGSTITSGVTSTPGLASFTIGTVPEPGVSALALFGSLGLLLRRRRA